MHGGHQAALDAEAVVQHLGYGSQAVGGARGVGNDGLARVALVVHAKDKHGGVVLAGRGQDDLFGTCVNVLLGGFFGQEQAGGFDHHVNTHVGPFQVGRVTLLRQADLFAIDHQSTVVYGDVALEAAVHRVKLQHVGQIVGFQQVVDGDNFDVLEVLYGGAKHHAADAAKAVDTNFDGHVFISSS